MSRRLTERDVAHDADPVRFGDAMLRCEGYAPACCDAGRCLNGGSCFASPAHLVAARMIEGLIDPSAHATGLHYAYLRRAAEMLRADRIGL